jgi:pyruvate formate lyase activating enzyme
MDHFGLQKTTLIDFPGLVAATIFIPGCNLRCPYCHNPELVKKIRPDSLIPFDRIISFLHKRQKVLGGVCLSGGEPLLYEGLPGLIDTIHSLDLKVKIDTNGTLPEKLCSLSMDYVAMDIKTGPGKYHLLGNHKFPGMAEKIKDSINWIISSGIPHEFRTTIAPGIVEKQDIEEICSLIQGADRYMLSQFRPLHTLDPGYEQFPPTPGEILKEFLAIAEKAGIPCKIRQSGKTNPNSKITSEIPH